MLLGMTHVRINYFNTVIGHTDQPTLRCRTCKTDQQTEIDFDTCGWSFYYNYTLLSPR